jgi:hypothetical protein
MFKPQSNLFCVITIIMHIAIPIIVIITAVSFMYHIFFSLALQASSQCHAAPMPFL